MKLYNTVYLYIYVNGSNFSCQVRGWMGMSGDVVGLAEDGER
jgi:hypothetical protein